MSGDKLSRATQQKQPCFWDVFDKFQRRDYDPKRVWVISLTRWPEMSNDWHEGSIGPKVHP
ncbi:hypothetical protein AFM12_05170 [Jiulongibacter sediminis]|uniref:Uncharacterized protein n=1 Tax=Jiulongibacter sediminis TaxID=1605367 RepID=A0A0N8HAE6_9BACT|nr:hypothetical protein AFM12_05170 [Jiulongibacter sediminis]TBX26989.1 hypothetical protein TK44_05175 [Jiulongibacter sediminis]